MSQPPNPEPRKSGQPAEPELTTEEQRRQAMEAAFDYRGDVTIHTRDGRVIEGYVFDRRPDARGQPCLRMMVREGGRVEVRYDEVARLIFSGRDPAAGKSWETWVRKYVQNKQRGESASIEPEPLGE